MLVTVVPHQSQWKQQFEAEAQTLQQTLGPIIQQVHHIGSTAVPGLLAKPIIDIILEVTGLEALDQCNPQLEQLGYEAMGEMGIPRRRYFRKGGDQRTHQIHAFQTGDAHVVRHLAFRDYLIAHPVIADQYGALKLEIAQRCNNTEQYWREKYDFVKHHEALALAWYQADQKQF